MDTYNSYESEFDCPAIYEITLRGKIDSAHLYGIEELSLSYLTQEDGSVCTIITGLLIDQAALNGILNLIGQMQLTIVSVLKAGDCL